jgi:UDP-N-acetylmuramate: L-alanyl-gamma-D-glutamyl-meso-diaminopimelate ligase
MGICGTGMGALAGMFRESGFRVTGSDEGIYPPMSDFLADLGIEVMAGYQASNLDLRPDLVIVGNVIRRTNFEAVELEKSGIPFTTMPGALNRYFVKEKARIVVTGTHGKTTVSAMIAHILTNAGLDPGFMIGGIAANFKKNYCLGKGPYFIIEGDEYDTAYFDKIPKFLHYHPDIGVITSCEFDHADIYDSLEQIQERFRAFTELIPPRGCLVAYRDDAKVREIADSARSKLEFYGSLDSTGWSAADTRDTRDGMAAVIRRGRDTVGSGTLPVFGFHNLMNALAAIATAANVGIEPVKALEALASFRGVKRRQEVVGEIRGIMVVDDFAHHPTAVRVTCDALRSRYPDRRLVAVFEPRSNTSRRAVFQIDYVPAFRSADVVVLREPRARENLPLGDVFSSARLARDLRGLGKDAWAFEDTDGVLGFLLSGLRSGDVALVMSNGSFDDLNARLMRGLEERDQ